MKRKNERSSKMPFVENFISYISYMDFQCTNIIFHHMYIVQLLPRCRVNAGQNGATFQFLIELHRTRSGSRIIR